MAKTCRSEQRCKYSLMTVNAYGRRTLGSAPVSFIRFASARDATRRHRPGLLRVAAAEQCLEERDDARSLRSGSAPLTAAGRGHLVALALLHGLDHAALGLDRRQRTAVDVVDVAADLQLAGVVDEGVLLGQVYPDRHRQLDILLAGP